MLQHGVEQAAVVQVHLHVLRAQAHLLQRHDEHGEHLHLRHPVRLAHHVRVPLVVLALAPPGHALVPEALGNAEPFQRKGQRVPALQHQPGQGGRHFRPQGEPPAALVLEGIQLLGDLVAGLAHVELLALQHAGVVLLEAELAGGLAPDVEQPVPQPHFLRVEVPDTFHWLQGNRHGS